MSFQPNFSLAKYPAEKELMMLQTWQVGSLFHLFPLQINLMENLLQPFYYTVGRLFSAYLITHRCVLHVVLI